MRQCDLSHQGRASAAITARRPAPPRPTPRSRYVVTGCCLPNACDTVRGRAAGLRLRSGSSTSLRAAGRRWRCGGVTEHAHRACIFVVPHTRCVPRVSGGRRHTSRCACASRTVAPVPLVPHASGGRRHTSRCVCVFRTVAPVPFASPARQAGAGTPRGVRCLRVPHCRAGSARPPRVRRAQAHLAVCLRVPHCRAGSARPPRVRRAQAWHTSRGVQCLRAPHYRAGSACPPRVRRTQAHLAVWLRVPH